MNELPQDMPFTRNNTHFPLNTTRIIVSNISPNPLILSQLNKVSEFKMPTAHLLRFVSLSPTQYL